MTRLLADGERMSSKFHADVGFNLGMNFEIIKYSCPSPPPSTSPGERVGEIEKKGSARAIWTRKG